MEGKFEARRPKTREESLSPDFFEELYDQKADPWDFETSAYEKAKYAATLAALPLESYSSGFEIGCSIGVFTRKLAARCEKLLAVDVSRKALEQARARCLDLPQVKFELIAVPAEYPEQQFDLTLLSEVGYFWSWEDLEKARELMISHLLPGGHLLLVHWTPLVEEFPRTGDEVHEYFGGFAGPGRDLRHLFGRREEKYRIDLFERAK